MCGCVSQVCNRIYLEINRLFFCSKIMFHFNMVPEQSASLWSPRAESNTWIIYLTEIKVKMCSCWWCHAIVATSLGEKQTLTGESIPGSLSVLSEPLGKSITHCPNCDSCCRILIAWAFCGGSSQWVWTLFSLPGVRCPLPLSRLNLCSSLHLCTAYNSAESNSSSFVGITVLSA